MTFFTQPQWRRKQRNRGEEGLLVQKEKRMCSRTEKAFGIGKKEGLVVSFSDKLENGESAKEEKGCVEKRKNRF